MDNRNVFVAIALSLAVLLFWGAFFETPKPIGEKNLTKEKYAENKEVVENNNITPNINETKLQLPASREESINKAKRVKIENKKIKGSISLQGGIFDDLSFKDYRKDLDKEDNVVFLNPKESENGYFVETGWTSIGNTIKVPTINSTWSIVGNNTLGVNKPIVLEWDNKEGIIFRKKIEVDEKYLFKINQEVQNNTNKTIELYPYAQITRNKKPDDVKGFYILHEGFIGVFDEELKEEDYDDIEEKEEVKEANNGWLGITDKYWMTAIVPPKDENFKSTFVYKNAFKANYILNKPVNIAPSSKKENQIRLFVAAKEVETIDSYAETQGIDKFDLVIDWGWFYFFTKPLFFVIDYLFKITGNFGIAIMLITAAIRIIFFPLASYSFRSMAKMKALQPEMTRLKDIHKEDKEEK